MGVVMHRNRAGADDGDAELLLQSWQCQRSNCRVCAQSLQLMPGPSGSAATEVVIQHLVNRRGGSHSAKQDQKYRDRSSWKGWTWRVSLYFETRRSGL